MEEADGVNAVGEVLTDPEAAAVVVDKKEAPVAGAVEAAAVLTKEVAKAARSSYSPGGGV